MLILQRTLVRCFCTTARLKQVILLRHGIRKRLTNVYTVYDYACCYTELCKWTVNTVSYANDGYGTVAKVQLLTVLLLSDGTGLYRASGFGDLQVEYRSRRNRKDYALEHEFRYNIRNLTLMLFIHLTSYMRQMGRSLKIVKNDRGRKTVYASCLFNA